MTPPHSLLCNRLSLGYPTNVLYPLQYASDLPHSQTYAYISENKFGPSNQIIVPTGYKVMLVFSLTAYFSVSRAVLVGISKVLSNILVTFSEGNNVLFVR